MLDLILGYLLVIVILFSVNIGLFLGNFKFNDKKKNFHSRKFFLICISCCRTSISKRVGFCRPSIPNNACQAILRRCNRSRVF